MRASTLAAWTACLGAIAGICLCADAPQRLDEGELAAAAFTLGGSHPPGQLLHALLGYGLTLLPIGPVGFRLALLSVLPAALCGWFVWRLAHRVSHLRSVWWLAPLPVASALWLMPLLRQALRVEVYALAAALWLWASTRMRSTVRGLSRLAIVGAMLAVLHPAFALGLGVAVGVNLVAQTWRSPFQRGRFQAFALSSLVALVALTMAVAYLPLRAAAGARLWGDPLSWKGLTAYLGAASYRQNVSESPAELVLRGFGAVFEYADRVAHHPFFIAMVIATVFLPWGGFARRPSSDVWKRTARRSFIARQLVTVAAATLIIGSLRSVPAHNPDAMAYFLPIVLTGLGLIWGETAAGITRLTRAHMQAPRWWIDAGFLSCAAIVLTVPWQWRKAQAAANAVHPSNRYLATALTEAPPSRALVLVETDASASNLMYAQAVLGARPDVALLVAGLAGSSWHWKSLAGHPLFDGSPPQPLGRPQNAAGPISPVNKAYARGGLRRASGQVAALTESGAWLAQSRICGALLTPVPSVGCGPSQRLLDGAWRLTTRFSPGDHDALPRAAWGFALSHSTFLAQAGAPAEAARVLATALGAARPKAVALLARLKEAQALPGSWPLLVQDDAGPGASLETLVRQGARLLSAAGYTSEAIAMLADSPEGTHALAQVAAIHLAHGHLDRASDTLDAVINEVGPGAPLPGAVRTLRAALDRASPER